MDELVAFLVARLDEDEQVALAAKRDGNLGAGVWVQGSDEDWSEVDVDDPSSEPTEVPSGYVLDEAGRVVVYDEGTPSPEEAGHIARWDPARVLREVAATSALIQTYEEACRFYADEPDLCVAGEVEGLRTGLKLRAGVYSDHPGFREEWRPT